MKSITIHGIDPLLSQAVKAKAEAEGLSVNKTVKQILETALGIQPRPRNQNLNDFNGFCGVWGEADLIEFEEKISDTRGVDPEDWQ